MPPNKTEADHQTERELFAIATRYHHFREAHQRSPANAEELTAFELDPNHPKEMLRGYPKAIEKDVEQVPDVLKTGKYVVMWNANTGDYHIPQGQKLLVYVRNASEDVYVCFQNLKIKKISSREFLTAIEKTRESDAKLDK